MLLEQKYAFSREIGLPSGFAAVRKPDNSIFRIKNDVPFVCTLRRLSTRKKARAEGFELHRGRILFGYLKLITVFCTYAIRCSTASLTVTPALR